MGSLTPVPTPELINEVLDELGIGGRTQRQWLGNQLFAHAHSYSGSRYLERTWSSPHKVRGELKATAGDLQAVTDRLAGLPPEYQVVLSRAFSEKSDNLNWKQLLAGLELATSLTEKLSAIKLSKKRPDRMLKNSVGGLMLLLENMTGRRASVRPRRDGHEPELASVEAQVIGKLLRSVNPRLSTITLVNTINGICRANRGKPLEDFEHQLFLGGTIRPH